MPKRKATTQLSGLVGSDDEDVIQMNGDNTPEPEERAVKRVRGRPAKAAADKVEAPQTKSRVPAASAQEPAKKKRGRPKGSGTRAVEEQEQEQEQHEEPVKETKQRKTKAQSKDPEVSSDDMEAPTKKAAPKTTKAATDAKPAAPRGRKKASTEELEDTHIQDDSDFEYTPLSQKFKSPKSKEHAERPSKIPETQQPDPNVVEESFLPDLPAPRRSLSVSPSKADRKRPSLGFSPSKRKTGDSAEPELRRKIGDLTRKCETLEHRYRSLKEIGVAEATSNVVKLTKQCDTITAGMCLLSFILFES